MFLPAKNKIKQSVLKMSWRIMWIPPTALMTNFMPIFHGSTWAIPTRSIVPDRCFFIQLDGSSLQVEKNSHHAKNSPLAYIFVLLFSGGLFHHIKLSCWHNEQSVETRWPLIELIFVEDYTWNEPLQGFVRIFEKVLVKVQLQSVINIGVVCVWIFDGFKR